jgi:hypothetical protein
MSFYFKRPLGLPFEKAVEKVMEGIRKRLETDGS